jgi:hypothetical protein
MAEIKVTLRPSEKRALIELAKTERRDPRQQAALIVVKELERAGMLPVGGRNTGAATNSSYWANVAVWVAQFGRVIVPMAISVLIDLVRKQMRAHGWLP